MEGMQRLLTGLVLLLGSASGKALELSQCDGPSSTTLSPATRAPTAAEAVWLDQRRLVWPAVTPNDGEQLKLQFYGGMRAGEAPLFSATLASDTSQVPAEFVYLQPDSKPLRAWRLNDADLTRANRHSAGLWLLQHLDRRGKVVASTRLQAAKRLDALFPEAAELALGVYADTQHSRFAVWAPTARRLAVCLYPSAAAKADALLEMRFQAASGAWLAEQAGNRHGQYYRYIVELYLPELGWVRNLVSDPYAISANANGERSYIHDLKSAELAPKGWDEQIKAPALKHAVDMSIYELHVRDFSVGDDSVSLAARGRYLAFTEGSSRGNRHLRALADAGLTDVHLLPVFDFASVPEDGCKTPVIPAAEAASEAQQAAVVALKAEDCFNWGYDPQHFGAPEGSYASDANDGAVRIREFRAMVDAMHRVGLRVGMDVVYNHTSHAAQHPYSVLDRIVPGYYHRLNAKGEIERSTCCENTATEHRMMAKLMIDTAVRWVRDYRIDSFRFDLMGHQPLAAMQALQAAVNTAAGKTINLLGEGWNFGEVANNIRFVQAAQRSLAGSGIASFSDRSRDAARGGGCCDSGADLFSKQGFLNGLHYAPNDSAGKSVQDLASAAELARAADLIKVGLAGSLRAYTLRTHDGKRQRLAQIDYVGQPAGYVEQPGEVVNYVENHDNPTLFDINVLKLPAATSAAERARVQVLGMSLIALSQGIAYYHAGMEALRSKSLDRNSFDSGDWFNRIDWRFESNFFASGLPPKSENGGNYAAFTPLLRAAHIKPTAADIAWTRDMFLAWLKLRASTALLRLPNAELIQARLQFLEAKPKSLPSLVAAVLDGANLPDSGFARLAYFINADIRAQSIEADSESARRYQLHPIMQSSDYPDTRAKQATYDSARGRFTIPPRTAVVFIVDIPKSKQ